MRRIDDLRQEVRVLRARLGQPEAFRLLIEQHHMRLLYYLRRLLPDPDTADDVLQEVWLTVWQRLDRLEEPRAFAAWLYGIARNKVLQRRRVKDWVTNAEEELNDVPADDVTEGSDEAEAVHLCIGRLSLAQREVLTLRFVQEMSYEEMAAVIGCAVGTVRSRLHYAKRALKVQMETLEHER